MHLLCTRQRVTSAWGIKLSILPAWILCTSACNCDLLQLPTGKTSFTMCFIHSFIHYTLFNP